MCPSISRGGRGYSRIYFYYIKLKRKSQYAGTANLLAPLSLVRGGIYYYSSGSLNYQSYLGRYWSRRLYNAGNSYGSFFNSGSVLIQGSDYHGYGFAVRCLGR